MKKNILVCLLFSVLFSFSQEKTKDTLIPQILNEIILIGKKGQLSDKQSKTLTSIDDYLQQSAKVDMIKRGAYAWEPIINSMSTERTLND